MRSALGAIQAHRLRSFLTMLGIIIGVASVICVIAMVQGLSSRISSLFEGLGSSTLTLQADTPLADRLRGQVNRLRLTDLDELRYRMDGISHITPIVPVSVGSVTWDGQTAGGQFFGTTGSLQDVQHLFPRTGRFITDSDDQSRRRVVVLGDKIRKDLKMPERPEGEFVQLGREWFKVIGVMEPRGEVFGQNLDLFMLMPYQTALSFTTAQARPDFNITFVVDEPDAVANVKQRVIALIRRAHGLTRRRPQRFPGAGLRLDRQDLRADHQHDHAGGRWRRRHLAAGRRHRHHEHHAGVGDRAHPRDRHRQGAGGAASLHHAAVPDRGNDARGDRRHHRHGHRALGWPMASPR